MTRPQPNVSARRKRILEIDGLRFRDLDGDGALSPYEDWRLSPEERAADLLARLPLEHKAGLMIIGSQYMAGSPWVPEDGGRVDFAAASGAAPLEPAPGGSLLRTEDQYTDRDPITGAALPAPALHASSARGAILLRHQRRMIVRDTASARTFAAWANELQELAEESAFGIPVLLTSNPRNHVSAGATLGVGEGVGVFSQWPSELGLAATADPGLVGDFAAAARREWRAVGLHKLYGYMADVPSEPRWARFGGTLGEDPTTAATLMRALVRGFQGEALGPESVALTVKHFPGGGVRTDGHDPHFPWGKVNEYPTPGSLETYQLPPFVAAIDAGVSSVMPYYAQPANTSAPQLPDALRRSDEAQFEEVAFAYNRAIITGLLRERLGFAGYVNTDSGVLETMAYGVEDLKVPERWARAVRAGSDLVGDVADPAALIAAVRTGALREAELDGPVVRLLTEMFALGLFEDPYVDPERAEAVIADAGPRARAEEAQRRSVTLLRNDAALLPLPAAGLRVHVEVFARRGAEAMTADLRGAIAALLGEDSIATDPSAADAAVLWVRPALSLFGDDRPDAPLPIDPRELGIDVDRFRAIEEAVPTVLAVDLTNPWLLAEIEPAAAALLATYEISPANLAAVLLPGHGFRGRLPLTVPRSIEAVASSPRDVPGMFCGDDYAYVDRAGSTYRYGFGLPARPASADAPDRS